MGSRPVSANTGRAALRALIKEGLPLGPLKVMAKHVGRSCCQTSARRESKRSRSSFGVGKGGGHLVGSDVDEIVNPFA